MIQPGDPNNIRHFKLLFEESGNENLYEKITDFFPAIIYVYDAANEKIGYVNKQLKEVLGYSYEDVKEWDGDMMKMVFKDDVDSVKKELSKYSELEDESSHSFNCRFNHKAGNSHHFQVKGTVLRRDEKGKPSSLLFVAQDVSSEKMSENEARAAKKLIRDSEELLQYGTWRLDISSGKMEWSDGMYALMGYEKKDVADPDLDFFLKHIDISSLNDFKTLMEEPGKNDSGFERTFEITTAHKEKRRVSTKTRLVVDDDGKALSLLGLTWDITSFYSLYEDLLTYKNMVLEKELFLKSGSWEYNAVTGRSEWSEGMYHLFGYDPLIEKANLKIDENFFSAHQSQEEMKKCIAEWNDAINTEDHFIRESIIKSKDGHIKRIETYGKVTRSADGSPLKVFGTTRDVTKLKEYELKLEAKVAELARSNKELEEFAYVASHDLQEPLRKITTFSERLNAKFSDKLGNDGKEYLNRMVIASENMRMLIENLLDFSRTTRNELFFEATDLNIVLREALKEQELKLEETRAVIIAGELPVVDAIPSQIGQLFGNLISNAVKFTRPGTPPQIKISSYAVDETEKKRLQLHNWIKYFAVEVEDNGIGFETQYSSTIFKIFQRLHGKSEYPGSGIGLAICKKIIDHHKGVIYAESERSKGSKFTFILPEKQYG
jgi:PAS domain S-box-containing protein